MIGLLRTGWYDPEKTIVFCIRDANLADYPTQARPAENLFTAANPPRWPLNDSVYQWFTSKKLPINSRRSIGVS